MYLKKQKIKKPVFVDSEIINQWQKELFSFYGFDVQSHIIIKAFYFSLGQLSVIDNKSFFPFLDSDGNMVNLQSTMKREMLIDAIALLTTGYEFPKNKGNKKYSVFFEKLLDSSLLSQTT